MSEGRAPVAVVGGGGFGQGIARAAARQGLEVLLWSRSPRNLEGVKDTTSFVEVARAGLIFLAVPSPFVEAVAGEMGQQLDGRHYLVHVSRGLVGDALEPISLALRRVTPCRRVGALGGPLVAEALRDGTPSGAVVGTHFPEVADA
ncbi:MAG TPA: NAD(P)-binding domain-containing protein, partial [Polyangiaceae bacterium LLY-WYZ-15_(1-7)]|nr:NAD(P)-binding domain-containing protein [Polyangiaceae bacterium LLY-WYZ-15_(1-7)]